MSDPKKSPPQKPEIELPCDPLRASLLEPLPELGMVDTKPIHEGPLSGGKGIPGPDKT